MNTKRVEIDEELYNKLVGTSARVEAVTETKWFITVDEAGVPVQQNIPMPVRRQTGAYDYEVINGPPSGTHIHAGEIRHPNDGIYVRKDWERKVGKLTYKQRKAWDAVHDFLIKRSGSLSSQLAADALMRRCGYSQQRASYYIGTFADKHLIKIFRM